MDSQLRSQVVFHLTGRHGDPAAATALPRGLRPALLAPYRRLQDLRHDYPLVLADGAGEYAVSLTAVVDGALRAVAPEGASGEALRKRALQVETRVRHRVAAGERGKLGALWQAVVEESRPARSRRRISATWRLSWARLRATVNSQVAMPDCLHDSSGTHGAWSSARRLGARSRGSKR